MIGGLCPVAGVVIRAAESIRLNCPRATEQLRTLFFSFYTVFKNTVRRRVMQVVEPALQAAEARYEEERQDLILSQANEIQQIHERHHQEHENLLDKIVKGITRDLL